MSFYQFQAPSINERQIAILIASVRNALGGKAKPEDFIFSKKANVKENTVEAQGYKPIDKDDLAPFLRST